MNSELTGRFDQCNNHQRMYSRLKITLIDKMFDEKFDVVLRYIGTKSVDLSRPKLYHLRTIGKLFVCKNTMQFVLPLQ